MTRILLIMVLAVSGSAIAQSVPSDDVGQLQSATFLKSVRAAEAEASAKLAAASPVRLSWGIPLHAHCLPACPSHRCPTAPMVWRSWK